MNVKCVCAFLEMCLKSCFMVVHINIKKAPFFSRMQRTKAEQQLRVVPSHLGVENQDDDEDEGKPGESKEGSKSEQAKMKG